MSVTTIQIKSETLHKLKSLKEYARESYDEVINNLIGDNEAEILTEEEIVAIKEGLEDVKAGRIHSIEEVASEFGVELN